MKLRTKFFLLISVLLSCVVGFVALCLLTTERRFLLEEVEKRQKTALNSIEGILQEAHLTRDPLLLVNYLKLIKQAYPAVSWLCITDQEGMIQANLDIDLLGMNRDLVTLPEGLHLLSQAVQLNGRNLGQVEVGFHKKDTDGFVRASLAKVKRRVAVIGIGALTLGLLGSFLLAFNLSRPIKILCRAAAEIGEGKLETKIPIERGDELGHLARAFQEMNARLKELDQIKQDFVATTTHELRTPLGAIVSHANAVLEDLEETQEIPAARRNDWFSSMTYIKANASRLGRFINDLLDIAKIERGRMDLSLQNVSMNEIIEEVMAFLHLKAEEKKIHLLDKVQQSLPVVRADPERLHQVFLNLLGNAIKFTPQEGQIEVSAKAYSPSAIYVEISDTGPGIPTTFMKRLFNKFEQVKSLRDQVGGPKGTGLGLAICKGIIEGHGGRIGATSRLGRGTTVHFTLPTIQVKKQIPLEGK